jgi:hypothetical protein
LVDLTALLLTGPAMAQQEQPAPAAPDAPATETQPGYITQFGSWLNRPLTTEAAKDAANATLDVATSIIRLPGTRLVAGRHRCEPAPNGAPDCQAAASSLCRARGFQTGRSLDMQSEQKCPASVWLSGSSPAEGECGTEHYVTRAVCQ